MRSVHTLDWSWALVPAALVVGAAIIHAGQPGDTGNSFPTPNPCSLLSSAEIGVAGEAVHDGVILFRYGSIASCSFARTGGGHIAVLIRRPPSGVWAAEQVGRMRRGVGFGSYLEVGGVGQHAFLLDRKGAAVVLCVFENPYYLQISVLGALDGRNKTEFVQELGRTALRRLASVTSKNGVIAVRKTGEAPQ